MSKKITLEGLRKFNLTMAGVHAVQAVAVLIIASPSKGLQPISTNYLTYDNSTKSLLPATRHLFDMNLAWLVAAFFLMSAVAHLYIATRYRKNYESDLKKGINRVRWFEYSISASTMMVAIATLSGIFDVSSLVMIFALNVIMNMMGLAMELQNQKVKKPNWFNYIIGCIAGIIPWIVFAIYTIGATIYGDKGVPTFVYFIYISIFICFNSFAVIMYLQYKKKGKWSNYLYGERAYIILSLVAKTLLAWQVFAGTLRP